MDCVPWACRVGHDCAANTFMGTLLRVTSFFISQELYKAEGQMALSAFRCESRQRELEGHL